jgi:hypothetical protein
MKRLLLILAACLGTVGCASLLGNVDEDYMPRTDSALVVYSTRVDDNCSGALPSLKMDYEYLKDGNSKKGGVLLMNTFVPSAFEDRDGFFRIVEWPASEYVFTNVVYSSTKVGMVKTKSYEMKAKLEGGKTYYLGEFHAKLPNCHQVIISVNDEHERDGAIFDSRMKELKSTSFVRGVLPTGVWRVQ